MRDPAAGLLTIFLWGILCATFHPTFVSSTLHPSSDVGQKNVIQNQSSSESHLNRVDETSTIGLPNYARPVINPKELLLQEIRTLDENVKMQEEVAKTIIKAGAQKSKPHSTIPPRPSKKPINLKTNTGKKTTPPLLSKIAHITTPATVVSTKVVNHTDSNDQAMKKLLEAEDMGYDDDDDDEDDRSEEDDDEEDEEDDEYDDDDDEDEDLTEDEEVMTQCPDYCRCSGQYASATTARCTKLVDEQNFGTGIAHLVIDNAGEIRLGPYALRDRGLQQLESITFADTRIIEMDRAAFDGITYLFAVNLTRNALLDIHPQMFQNNSQLSLLTISGNPLKHNQYFKPNRHSILDAPSVTQFDFSSNGVTRLPRTAFSSMTSLAYISLRDNRLKEIERDLFRPLEALVELDLSNNLLNDLPDDLFKGSGLQTLRVSGNNLTTLATIIASNLTTLEAANNRIRYIAKEDLASLPELDRLVIRSNGMKRIHQHAFSNLDQLLYLDISDNKLTSLTEHHLRTNPRLQVLLMNDNPGLESLPVFKTAGLEYDTFSVYRFECANCGLNNLAKGTFNAMPALTRLNLARNRLTGLPDGLLSQLSSLRELDLSDNIIDTLGVNMFHGTTSLTKLNLAGNPLVTLQVSAFLGTPSLTRIDVSRCALERVWSEARAPLKSLRFLSVRGNLLRRITVEELKAMPNLSGLDLSHNPLECNDEFHSAVHWLSEHGVTPTETLKYFNDFINSGNYVEIDGTTEWSDFVNIICNEDDGPPPRPVPHKPNDNHVKLETNDPALKKNIEDEITFSFQFNHGIRHDERIEDTWTNQNQEYEDFASIQQEDYRPWYYGAVWPVITIILITLAVLLLIAHCAVCMSKQRGRGPVIRPPMMLRPGLIDNKNCGLVYKPLHEEIPTPHMPKRGSFYSSSTFHYDKIVPESV